MKIIEDSEDDRITSLLWAELKIFCAKVYASKDSMSFNTEALQKLDLGILRGVRASGFLHDKALLNASSDLQYSREYPLLYLLILIRFPSLLVREDTNPQTFLTDRSKDRGKKIFRIMRRLVMANESRLELLVPVMLCVRSIYGESFLFEFKRGSKIENAIANEYKGAFPSQLLLVRKLIEESLRNHYTAKYKAETNEHSLFQRGPSGFYYLLYSLNLAISSRFVQELIFYFWIYNIKIKSSRRETVIWAKLERVLVDKMLPIQFTSTVSVQNASLVMPKIDFDYNELGDSDDVVEAIIHEWKEYKDSLQLHDRPMSDTLFAFQIFWKAVIAECGLAWNTDEELSRVRLRNLVFKIKSAEPELFRLIVTNSPGSYYRLSSFPTALGTRSLFLSSYTSEEREYYELIVSLIEEYQASLPADLKLQDLISLVELIPSPIESYYSIEESSIRESEMFPDTSSEIREMLGDIGLAALSYGLMRDVSITVKGRSGLDGEWGRGLFRVLKEMKPDLFQSLIAQ